MAGYEWVQRKMDDPKKRKWLCSLDAKHWKSQNNFEQVKNSSATNTIQRVQLFKGYISVELFYAFVAYSPTDTEEHEAKKLVDGLIVGLSGLRSWFGTAARCLTQKETRGGQRQKLYNDACRKLLLRQ